MQQEEAALSISALGYFCLLAFTFLCVLSSSVTISQPAVVVVACRQSEASSSHL